MESLCNELIDTKAPTDTQLVSDKSVNMAQGAACGEMEAKTCCYWKKSHEYPSSKAFVERINSLMIAHCIDTKTWCVLHQVLLGLEKNRAAGQSEFYA